MLASAVVRWNGELQRRDDLVRDAAVRDPGHVQVRVEHELEAVVNLAASWEVSSLKTWGLKSGGGWQGVL